MFHLFHRHKWTKWHMERYQLNRFDGKSFLFDQQERTCHKCGLKQTRRL